MPDPDGKTPPAALDLSIDELESLLAEARRSQAQPEHAIPVLDEEVGATPAAPAAAPAGDEPLTPRQLADLSQRLQQRVDAELEELADVIRNVVKRCILEELRKELPRPPGRGAAPKPGPTENT